MSCFLSHAKPHFVLSSCLSHGPCHPAVHTQSVPSVCSSVVSTSAGSIPKISKYRDTCESSIPIFRGIAILRYFWYQTPTIRYLRYFRYLRYLRYLRHRVHSTKSMRRRNIVVDDDVVYGSYHYSASQPKLT